MGGIILAGTLLAILAVFLAVAVAQPENFPERDMTLIVAAPPGTLTDLANRTVAHELGEVLGTDIHVINVDSRPAGVQRILQEPRDGHTLLGFSEAALPAIQRATGAGINDWYPLIIGGPPTTISVASTLEYETLEDLISAARMAPGAIRISGGPIGLTSYLNFVALEEASQSVFEYAILPISDIMPAVAGGRIEVIIHPLNVQEQAIRAHVIRPLGVFSSETFHLDGYGDIPSVFESLPELREFPVIPHTIAMALPPDVPNDVANAVTEAFISAIQTESVRAVPERC